MTGDLHVHTKIYTNFDQLRRVLLWNGRLSVYLLLIITVIFWRCCMCLHAFQFAFGAHNC